jgi:hypothetical protein
MSDFKPKDIFNILQVSPEQAVINHIIDWAISSMNAFLPEEVVILVNMIGKVKAKTRREHLIKTVEQYLTENLTEMEYHEIGKVYMSCRMKVRAELSEHFVTCMESYLLENIK